MAWRSSNVLYTGHSATASKPIRRTSNLFQYKQQHKQQQHSNKRSKSKSNNNHHHQGAPPPFLCSSVFVSPWCDLPACAVRGSSVVVVVGSGVVVVVVVTGGGGSAPPPATGGSVVVLVSLFFSSFVGFSTFMEVLPALTFCSFPPFS